MDWYWIVIVSISFILTLILLTSFICYKMCFYNKDRDLSNDKIVFPDEGFYVPFKDVAIAHIKMARAGIWGARSLLQKRNNCNSNFHHLLSSYHA